MSEGYGPFAFGDPFSITAYATARTTAADNYILMLGQLSGSLTPPVITAVFPTGPTSPLVSIPAPPTNLQSVVWTAPGLPAAFTEPLVIEDSIPAPFDQSPPVLSFGAAPTPFSEVVPDAPGVDTNFTYPTLSLSLPSAPSLISINVSPFEGFTMPQFTAETINTLNIVAPSVREYVPGAMYTSTLLTELKDTLYDRIHNGGTGLNPNIETAIFDRAREREARTQADGLAQLDRMEAFGFSLPPGVYVDARLKLLTETNYQQAGASREIMIKQAELEQANVLKALDVATSLEGKLIDYSNSVEQRIFEGCKYATEAGVQVYNAQVQAYSAYLEAYKTKVSIYEAQIRAENLRIEAYKSQLEAEKTKAQINTALVEQFRVLSEVALSNVEIYKAEIDAIRAKAEIEKLKVDIYGEQVKAYGARVNAFTAQVEGFRAVIQAEASKQDAFKSSVEAYSAQVTAAVKIIEAKIEAYKGRIASKTAEFDGYKAAVQAESSRAQSIAQSNSSIIEAYKATVQGNAAYNETLTKQWQVALDQTQRVTEIAVSTAKANAELYMTTRSLALDAAKVGAQVSAQLGAASLNALNWSTSISQSNSNSVSRSTSTNYNYSASI